MVLADNDPRRAVADRVRAFWPEITTAARAHGLEPGLLAGLVYQESAGLPQAKRFERNYRWEFGDDPNEHPKLPQGVSLEQDLALQRWSYGLCQVMGAVAREYGFAGHLEELLDPTTNLDLGARHLANKIRQARGDIRQGLLRYNGGGDKAYPDKVLTWASVFADLPPAPVTTPDQQPTTEAAPREDAAVPVPFHKEETMPEWMMSMIINGAISLGAGPLTSLLEDHLPSWAKQVGTHFNSSTKTFVAKIVEMFKEYAASTPNDTMWGKLDNVLAMLVQATAQGFGLLPETVGEGSTSTPELAQS